MFQHENEYPVILVPGISGYGESTALGKVVPYFGRTATNAGRVISDMGLDCHTASFGILSGAWDRACELYAQIVGGTVDYGVAHSQRCGHPRYGKTYTAPMVPNWGRPDVNGKPVKITLVAHGFGAVVARLFIELMNTGSQQEKAATTDGTLSGLFMGGYNNIIHCLVTVAGINDGITTFQALKERAPSAERLFVKSAIMAEEIGLRAQFVDPYYAKHGLIVTQHGFNVQYDKPTDSKNPLKGIKFNEAAIDKYLSMKEDNIFYEMGIDGMAKLNNSILPAENTYYLAFAGSVTKKMFNRVTLPKLSAGILAPTSILISTFENYYTDKPIVTPAVHENDGLINTNASLPPITESATAFKSASRCQPGIWYQAPLENTNHLKFVGLFERPDVYRNQIYDLIKIISNLATI